MANVKHTPGPWRFERNADYAEQCRILKRPIEDHGGYYRGNDGSWVVMDSAGEITAPVANVNFRGKAKRGQAWCAPDPEGQSNALLIAAAPTMRDYIERKAAAGDAEARQILEAVDVHS